MTPPSIAAKAAPATVEWDEPHEGHIRYGRIRLRFSTDECCREAEAIESAEAHHVAACVNKLAGHPDLSAVAIVPVGVMEGVREALREAADLTASRMADSIGYGPEVHRAMLGRHERMLAALAALEAKADAGPK